MPKIIPVKGNKDNVEVFSPSGDFLLATGNIPIGNSASAEVRVLAPAGTLAYSFSTQSDVVANAPVQPFMIGEIRQLGTELIAHVGAIPTPTLTVNPTFGAIGVYGIVLTGAGFTPGDTMSITFDGFPLTVIPTIGGFSFPNTPLVVAKDWSWTATFTVPFSSYGFKTITATDQHGKTASAFFEVLPVYANTNDFNSLVPFHNSMWGVLGKAQSIPPIPGGSSPNYSFTVTLYEVVPEPFLPTGWTIQQYPATETLVNPGQTLPYTGFGVDSIGGTSLILPLSDTVIIGIKLVSAVNDFIDHEVDQLQALVRNGTSLTLGPGLPLPVVTVNGTRYAEPNYSEGAARAFSRVSDTEFVFAYDVFANFPTTWLATVVLGCSVSGGTINIVSQSVLAFQNVGGVTGLYCNGSTLLGTSTTFPHISFAWSRAGVAAWDGAGHLLMDGGAGFVNPSMVAFNFTVSGGVTGVACAELVPPPSASPLPGYPAHSEGTGDFLGFVSLNNNQSNASAGGISFNGSTYDIVLYPSISPFFFEDDIASPNAFHAPYLGLFATLPDPLDSFDPDLSYSWIYQSGTSVSQGATQVGIPARSIPSGPFLVSFSGSISSGGIGGKARHANNIAIILAEGDFRLPGSPNTIGQTYPVIGGVSISGSPFVNRVLLIIPFQVNAP